MCSTLLYNLRLENFFQFHPDICPSSATAPSADCSPGTQIPLGRPLSKRCSSIQGHAWWLDVQGAVTSTHAPLLAPNGAEHDARPRCLLTAQLPPCCSSAPEESGNPVTSQQAFNPVTQLSFGGCQQHFLWGPKLTESLGPLLYIADPLPAAKTHPPCSLLSPVPVSHLLPARAYPHLEQSFMGYLPWILMLMQELVPAPCSNSYWFQSTSCCLASEEEPMTFFLPLGFLNTCPKLISWLWLAFQGSQHG